MFYVSDIAILFFLDGIVTVPKEQAAQMPYKTRPISGQPDHYVTQIDVFHQLHCLVRPDFSILSQRIVSYVIKYLERRQDGSPPTILRELAAFPLRVRTPRRPQDRRGAPEAPRTLHRRSTPVYHVLLGYLTHCLALDGGGDGRDAEWEYRAYLPRLGPRVGVGEGEGDQ